MRYWYDTEFIEDGQTIDLISIGIVAEDGREYYAISTEFKANKASQWVKDNVLIHLPPRNPNPAEVSPRLREEAQHWESRSRIAARLSVFCDPLVYGKPEFWGYYSAYDHVALCQLFGTRISARWGRDSLCPAGAAFVSTMPAAPSGFSEGAGCEKVSGFTGFLILSKYEHSSRSEISS